MKQPIESFAPDTAPPIPRRAALHRLAGLGLGLSALATDRAAAQGAAPFPNKPVRIVVSYAAGGGVDAMVRLVAKPLSERLGQSVLVENRPGAGGTIGAAAVAAAAPDGHTVLAGGNPELTMMPHLMGKLAYDPLRDLAPLVLAAYVPSVLVVNPTVEKATTVAEWLESARRQPMPVATPGKGTQMHVALEVLNAQAGTRFVNTPYKGGEPAAQDVVAGQIGAAIVNLPPLRAHIASGRLRALAVMQAERSAQLPAVPTFREASGIENVSAPAWFAFTAPAAAPRPILARLETELRAVLADAALGAQLMQAGMDAVALPAEAFQRVMRAESAANAAAIKRFGITGE